MRGERREDQHSVAFQQAADGEDPVAVGGEESREAQAASGKIAAGARTKSPFTEHAKSEGQCSFTRGSSRRVSQSASVWSATRTTPCNASKCIR